MINAFEHSVGKQLHGFKLQESLRDPNAPDLRVVIADGAHLYFALAAAGSPARVFFYGRVDRRDVILSHPNARALDRV